MQKELLGSYAILEEKLKLLEQEKQDLRIRILEDLKKNNLDKIESGFGSFTVAKKTSWRYSDKISSLEDKVKIAKDKEQKKGIAESIISEYLLFKSI
jgi:hypothetical protein